MSKLLLIVFLMLEGGMQNKRYCPPPSLERPVNYVDWLNKNNEIPTVKNAAIDYAKAFDAIVHDEQAISTLKVNKNNDSWSKNELSTIRKWIAANDISLNLIEIASKKPGCYFSGECKSGVMREKRLPHLESFKTISALLLARIKMKLLHGDDIEGIVEDIRTTLRISQHLRMQPHLVELLTGEKIAEDVCRLLLHFPFTDRQIESLASSLLKPEVFDNTSVLPFERQMETERLEFYDILQRFCIDQDGDGKLERTKPEMLNMQLDKPLSIAELIEEYDNDNLKWVAALKADYLTGKGFAEKYESKSRSTFGDIVRIMTDGRWCAANQIRQTEATRNAVWVVLQLKLFFVQKGYWPNSLGEIISSDQTQYIRDPFSLGELKYRVVGDSPLLYSVGLNGEDDDGNKSSSGAVWGKDGDCVFLPN